MLQLEEEMEMVEGERWALEVFMQTNSKFKKAIANHTASDIFTRSIQLLITRHKKWKRNLIAFHLASYSVWLGDLIATAQHKKLDWSINKMHFMFPVCAAHSIPIPIHRVHRPPFIFHKCIDFKWHLLNKKLKWLHKVKRLEHYEMSHVTRWHYNLCFYAVTCFSVKWNRCKIFHYIILPLCLDLTGCTVRCWPMGMLGMH